MSHALNSPAGTARGSTALQPQETCKAYISNIALKTRGNSLSMSYSAPTLLVQHLKLAFPR